MAGEGSCSDIAVTVKGSGPLKAGAGALRIRKPKKKARKKTEIWRLNNQEAQKRFRRRQKVRLARTWRQSRRRLPFIRCPWVAVCLVWCVQRGGRELQMRSGRDHTSATCTANSICRGRSDGACAPL